jgi:hypothetical protein
MPSVVAIDATVYTASVARITAGEPLPRCGLKLADDLRGRRTPAQDFRKQSKLSAETVEAVLAGGTPEMVVLAMLNVASTKTSSRTSATGKNYRAVSGDTSGGRRAGVWWELVRQFAEAGVPVADLNLLSAERALLGKAKFGAAGYQALAARVLDLYPGLQLPQRVSDTGAVSVDPRYRVTTVGLAVCGALVAGIPTPVPPSPELLAVIHGGANFPRPFAPAKAGAA